MAQSPNEPMQCHRTQDTATGGVHTHPTGDPDKVGHADYARSGGSSRVLRCVSTRS